MTPKEPLLRFAEYAGSSARRQHCAGPPRPRGRGEPRGVHGPARGRPAVAPRSSWRSRPTRRTRRAPRRASPPRAPSCSPLLPRRGRASCLRGLRGLGPLRRSPRRLGLADDLMRLWWDVRPHPRLGTLEIRVPDQPTRLADTAAFAALVQALVAAADPGAAAADRAVYAQNRWAAARFGAAAGLIHPEEERLAPPGELLAELLERRRADGAAPGLRRLSSGGSTASTRRARSSRSGAATGSAPSARPSLLSHTMGCDGGQVGDDAGERDSLRALRPAARRRGSGSSRGSSRRTPTSLGEVMLAWDDERVEREEIVAALDRAGFRPVAAAARPGIAAGSRAFAC